jgi:hypothetical protein
MSICASDTAVKLWTFTLSFSSPWWPNVVTGVCVAPRQDLISCEHTLFPRSGLFMS